MSPSEEAKRASPAVPSVEDQSAPVPGMSRPEHPKDKTIGKESAVYRTPPPVEMPGTSGLAKIASLIKSGKAKNIVVMTGAGMSTSAGIPDFRSPETGLYANLEKLNLPFPEAVFELGYFQRSPQAFWTLAKDLYPGKYLPTPAHYFLTLLHKHNHLLRVFSQNIDTLETLAGLPKDKIIEAHGSFATSHCLSCRSEASREYVLENGVREGKIVRCGQSAKDRAGQHKPCGGLVKPDIVFFGEDLPDRFFTSMGDLKKCDLLIVIGTSLQVTPFASLTSHVPTSSPRLLINLEAVGPFSRLGNARHSGSAPADKRPEGGLSKMLSTLYGASEEDETPHRDTWWGGQADEGCRELATELGWADELDDLIRTGRTRLLQEWGLSEDVVTGRPDAQTEALQLAEQIKRAEVNAEREGEISKKGRGRTTAEEELDTLLDKQLHISGKADQAEGEENAVDHSKL